MRTCTCNLYEKREESFSRYGSLSALVSFILSYRSRDGLDHFSLPPRAFILMNGTLCDASMALASRYQGLGIGEYLTVDSYL